MIAVTPSLSATVFAVAVAASIVVTPPPVVQEDAAVRLSFPVPDLDAARSR